MDNSESSVAFADHLDKAQSATDSESTDIYARTPASSRSGSHLSSVTTQNRLALEVEAVSFHSWEDAARRAVANAATNLSSITEVEVVRQTGTVEYGSIKEYYVKLRVYSSRMADMLKQQTTSTVNVSDPPVMASNSTDSEGLVQLDPVRPNTTDSLPTDVYASTTSPVETQHELAKHYQEIHNLGEKEKGEKK